MNRTCYLLLVVLVPALAQVPARAAGAGPTADAALTVLQQSCVECHSPDKRRGGLDLTTRDGLLKGGTTGPAFEPGTAAKDSLLYRMTAHLEEPFMPHKRDKLSDGTVEVLAKWLDAGAQYDRVLTPPKRATAETLWSFRPLTKPPIPAVRDNDWVRTPVDAFVQAAQERAGLNPSREADRRTLVRRLYFDLTGLPPTPDEVDAFVADANADAYEKLVDRLLASPRYGERWGRHWLDVARYADSMGYRYDDATPAAYRYRDWVIRAFNDDLPYDTFVRWQLAGDELAPGNPDAVTATGFCAVGPRERDEGDNLNRRVIRFNELDDIVSTTGAALLGLTVGCARCHDHKFDPVSQREYYQLTAAFAPGRRTNVVLDDPQTADRRRVWEAANDAVEGRRAEWFARYAPQVRPVIDALKGEATTIEAEFLAKTKQKSVADDLENVEFRLFKNVDGDAYPDFDAMTPRKAGLVRPARIDLSPVPKGKRAGLVLTGTLAVPADGDYTFELTTDARARVFVADQLVVESDGLNGVVTLDGRAALKPVRVPVRVEYLQGDYGTTVKLAWRGPGFELRTLSNNTARTALAKKLKARGPELLGAEKAKRYDDIDAALDAIFQNPLSVPECRAALPSPAVSEAEAIRREADALRRDAPPPPKIGLAYVDAGSNPGKSYLLKRGSVESPGEEVRPGPLAGLTAADYHPPAKPSDARGTFFRGALAHWMTDPERGAGRLLARVMVNRLWYHHFGEGLVRTPSDFGSQGDTPALPELLDWLAADLIDGGWRVKRLHKAIVMSSTYRQAAAGEPAAADPENRLWSRRRPVRAEAEALRDAILAVSGRLNPAMYGPGVKVPVPAELIVTRTEGPGNYPKDIPEGPDVWRRSVYVYAKRTVPVPATSLFDGADPSCSVGRRDRTTVAPQALMLMNSEFARGCGGAFADVVRRSAPDADRAWAEAAFRRALGRSPTAAEAETAERFLARQTRLRGGDRAAALTDFCQAVLSLNEFLYID